MIIILIIIIIIIVIIIIIFIIIIIIIVIHLQKITLRYNVTTEAGSLNTGFKWKPNTPFTPTEHVSLNQV